MRRSNVVHLQPPVAPQPMEDVEDALLYYGQQVIEIDRDNFEAYIEIAGSVHERITILKGMIMQLDHIIESGVVVCPCCNHEFRL